MKQLRILPILFTGILFSMNVFSQDKALTEYLHVPGPLNFDNTVYNLSWTSHPAANYYKQEYMVKGEDYSKFKSMMLLEVVTGEIKPSDAVNAKVDELKKMKLSNPMVNYEIIRNPSTGEYMLDFLVSQNNKDGVAEIMERNVYRYKAYTAKDGQSGVLLLGISKRSYGKDIDSFLASLKSGRKELLNKMGAYKIPDVVISR